MADKNPVASIGITDAQWNAADATQKKAWMSQVTNAQAQQPLSAFGSQSTTSGASQVATAVKDAATGDTIAAVGQWFNIAGALILGIVLVVLGVVLIMRRQVGAVAFPEATAVGKVMGHGAGD